MNNYSMEQYPIDIYQLLFRLGVTPCFRGYFEVAYAVHLCVENPEKLLYVTKDLYPTVAQHFHAPTWGSVERNIRTVSKHAWKTERALLESLAQRPLPRRPTAGYFIAILANHYRSPSDDSYPKIAS